MPGAFVGTIPGGVRRGGKVVTAAPPPAAVWQGGAASAADLSTYTFSGVTLGNTVAVFGRAGAANGLVVSSMTIGGNAATQLDSNEQDDGANCSVVAVWHSADVVAGGTGDIVVTFSGTMSRAAVSATHISGITLFDVADRATAFNASSAANMDLSLTATGTGVMLAAGIYKNGGATWEDDFAGQETYDVDVETFVGFSTAELDVTSGAKTITLNPDSASTSLQNGLSVCLQQLLRPSKVAGLAETGGAETTDTQIGIEWVANPDADTWKVEYKEVSSGTWTEFATGLGSADDDVTGLTADTSYNFRVRATNAAGDGPYSDTLTVSTNPAAGGGPYMLDANGDPILDANGDPIPAI